MTQAISELRAWQLRVSERTSWSILAVTTADGLTGFGEFSDGGDHLEGARWLTNIRPVVHGWDPDDGVLVLQQELFRLCRAAGPQRGFLYRTVAGAVIAAACDVLSQRSGMPLGQWLGGSVTGSVPLYANINRSAGRRRPEDFARVARSAVAAGFDTVKLAPFDGPAPAGTGVMENGLAVVRAVREAVGADVTLLVDVHRRLSKDEVITALAPLEELRIGWLEDGG